MDFTDDVDAIDHQRTAAGHPQGDMKYGPVLGSVDVFATEHRIAAFGHPHLRGV